MAIRITRSPKFYQERQGLRPTYRHPLPTLATADNPVHRYPMKASLPIPGYLLGWRPSREPDMIDTRVWHNGIPIDE